MTEWPRRTYMVTAASRMGINFTDMDPHQVDNIPSNILELKVFFKTLNTALLVEAPQYSDHSLLSSVGGAMSLYLGVSLVMVAELLEYLLLLLSTVLRYYMGRLAPTVASRGDDVTKIVVNHSNGVQMTYLGNADNYPVLKKVAYVPPTTTASVCH
ncbi:amiloride-sensitive sodium channel subunit gamma-like [Pollicipes pollicipes]|uniref:amiloride-sensitive sodium channel subunit gamma-like n=1 Tax=Pollicipes pollicipes TaxID=41117 RepID=UPI0018853FD3|nr:amiloride-sensitive sodium channel subunit gamma-like [Pollicipes pollicipes]